MSSKRLSCELRQDLTIILCGTVVCQTNLLFDVSFQIYLVRHGENVCPKIVVIASKVIPQCSMMYSVYADDIRSRHNVKESIRILNVFPNPFISHH